MGVRNGSFELLPNVREGFRISGMIQVLSAPLDGTFRSGVVARLAGSQGQTVNR